jgi:hypothetical protein
MPAPVAGIHVFLLRRNGKTWMAGTSPAMTTDVVIPRSRTCECIPIPVIQTSLILIASCPMRDRFLEAILSADRARAGRTGAPRNGRWPGGRWSAGRRCALPWARAVPCRARWVHHLPQGCRLVPWRLPPLHPLARFARDWQTSDALRRENAKPCPSFRGACALAQANPESRCLALRFNTSGFRVRAKKRAPE